MVALDLKGQKFARLTVISKTSERKSGSVVWLCKCDCGNIKKVSAHSLRKGNTRSCGCLKSDVTSKRSKKNLAGKQFGRLTVMEGTDERTHNRSIKWLCRCQCGNDVVVESGSLLRGHTRSCGCINSERMKYVTKNIRLFKKDFECKHKVDLSGERFGKLKTLCPTSERYRGKVIWECECDCGNRTKVNTNQLKSCNTQSCGCTQKNPNLTDEERLKGRYILGKEPQSSWRNKVYERDNYTCKVCKETKGGNFNAHHLDGWNWCKDKRFDVKNGITLCNKCHKRFHSIYGYGNNTKEQFEEYAKALV